MITGLVKTSYIAKNGNRLDAGYYLVGPRQVQRAERAVVESTAKVAAAKKRAEQLRIHMEKLRADGAVQIIEDSNKAEVEKFVGKSRLYKIVPEVIDLEAEAKKLIRSLDAKQRSILAEFFSQHSEQTYKLLRGSGY